MFVDIQEQGVALDWPASIRKLTFKICILNKKNPRKIELKIKMRNFA